MTLQNSFDLAKKQFERGSLEDGYIMDDGRKYIAYKTNAEWQDFRFEMEHQYPHAYKNYKDGDGGELEENKYPPKMASYGSSSCLIYMLSRVIPGFVFEKKLGINIPARNSKQEAQASLDGYLENKNIFVEAKCREIYSASHPEFNGKYGELYSYLIDKTEGLFQYDLKETKDKKGEIKRHVYFSWDGNHISQLDLKQLLCHMLGIGKKSLTELREQEPTLLYLVYRPSEELFGFLSKRTADSLRRFRETEEKEANTVCFKLIYKSIVYYLHDIKGVGSTLRPDEVERVANAFSFRFCDQTEYSALLK